MSRKARFWLLCGCVAAALVCAILYWLPETVTTPDFEKDKQRPGVDDIIESLGSDRTKWKAVITNLHASQLSTEEACTLLRHAMQTDDVDICATAINQSISLQCDTANECLEIIKSFSGHRRQCCIYFLQEAKLRNLLSDDLEQRVAEVLVSAAKDEHPAVQEAVIQVFPLFVSDPALLEPLLVEAKDVLRLLGYRLLIGLCPHPEVSDSSDNSPCEDSLVVAAMKGLKDNNIEVRALAAIALSRCCGSDSRVPAALSEAIENTRGKETANVHVVLMLEALESLGANGAVAVPIIIKIVSDSGQDMVIRQRAIECIGRIGRVDDEVIQLLREIVRNGEEGLKPFAREALKLMLRNKENNR